jgi:hypothetical protein
MTTVVDCESDDMSFANETDSDHNPTPIDDTAGSESVLESDVEGIIPPTIFDNFHIIRKYYSWEADSSPDH